MKTFDPSNFDQLREHVVNLFPEKLAPPAVSKEQQENALSALHDTIGGQRFYFLVDMPTFTIIRCAGIQTWMGHPEKEFSLKQYWNLVHPGNQVAAHTVFLQMANILCTGQFELQFMVQRYSSLTTLKHYNGHYVLCKRTASVFQYDKENRLTEYLNEFTIIGPYKGEPLSPSFFTNTGGQETERGKIILDKVKSNFPGMKFFSDSELRLANILADRTPGITQQKIAEKLKLSPNTIDTYYKRFLKKARTYFHIDFTNAQEAATYLREAGLL